MLCLRCQTGYSVGMDEPEIAETEQVIERLLVHLEQELGRRVASCTVMPLAMRHAGFLPHVKITMEDKAP